MVKKGKQLEQLFVKAGFEEQTAIFYAKRDFITKIW